MISNILNTWYRFQILSHKLTLKYVLPDLKYLALFVFI